jgi:ribosomal protein S27E
MNVLHSSYAVSMLRRRSFGDWLKDTYCYCGWELCSYSIPSFTAALNSCGTALVYDRGLASSHLPATLRMGRQKHRRLCHSHPSPVIALQPKLMLISEGKCWNIWISFSNAQQIPCLHTLSRRQPEIFRRPDSPLIRSFLLRFPRMGSCYTLLHHLSEVDDGFF